MDETDLNAGAKNAEWLRTKLKKVWNCKRFCGMCLEESNNLCPLDMEFVISKQKSSKSFLDLLNYIFKEDIENLVASSGICENCTEKALQAYIFMHNTRQLSNIMNDCVSDLYSKVLDLSQQLDEKVDCENANIMIILESEAQLYDLVEDMTTMEVMPINSPKLVKKHIIKENTATKEHVKIDLNQSNETDVIENIKAEFCDNDETTYSIDNSVDEVANSVEGNDENLSRISVQPEIYLKGGNIVINPLNTDSSSSLTINIHKCSQCEEIFTSYRKLKEHDKKKHKKIIYQCDICNKVYNTLQYLNIHYKMHFKSVCKICHKVLPNTELMQHLRTTHATSIQIHPCKFCNLVYYSKEALETHFKAIHLKNCMETEETKNQCAMCLRNVPQCEKYHKCKYLCPECFVNPCIHFRYLTSYREQVLNHSTEIKCIDCDYVTKRKEYLITHTNREHLNHHPFVCDDCGTQFYTKMSLRTHIEQFHNLNICEYCDKEFKSTKIKDHRELCKHVVRDYPCQNCIATFSTQEQLNNHVNLRHNNIGYSCNKCKRQFLTKMELEEHVAAIHRRIQCKKRRKNIECTLCSIKFNSVKEMLEHEEAHGEDEKYPCKYCSKEFYSLKKLYIHKQRHYDRIQCSGCKKRVITSFYPQHEARCPYRSSSTLSHMCETCGKSFHLESLLRLHQKSHMDSVPCPECNKMLKPSGLQKHLEKHGDKPKPIFEQKGLLVCNVCGHTAKRKRALEAHINRYHLKVKPFVCSVCDKQFCGKARLKEHMATHSNSNVCYCSVCGKKFANRVCLKLHFRMHTGELPYSCDVCGEKFRTSSIMKTHRIKKHLQKTVPCPKCDSMFYIVRDMRHHFKKTHWKNKDKPFDVKEILPEEYYHLFEDGRLAKITDEVIETEVIKSEQHLFEEAEQ